MSLQLTNVSIVIQILLYIAKKSISRFVYSRHYCILNKVPSAGRYQVEHRNTSLYKVEELNVCRRTQFRYKKLCGHVRISFGSFYYEASPELCHTWAQYSLLIGWSVTQYSEALSRLVESEHHTQKRWVSWKMLKHIMAARVVMLPNRIPSKHNFYIQHIHINGEEVNGQNLLI